MFTRLVSLGRNAISRAKPWGIRVAGAAVLAGYVALGIHTQWSYPFPYVPMYDFDIYVNAFHRALAGLNPYAYQDIMRAYLYPLPALVLLSPLIVLPEGWIRLAAYVGTMWGLCALMLWGVGRVYGYRVRQIWWWFPLAFAFAPFLEQLAAGQLNLISSFGVFLLFAAADSSLALAGSGLAIGLGTKLLPAVFAGYLLLRRRFAALGWGLIVTLAAFALSIAVFGWQSNVEFLDAANLLQNRYTPDTNSQALVSVLHALGWMESGAWVQVQRLLIVWIVSASIVSGLCVMASGEHEAFFIVLGFGATVVSNVMWYHYYVFLLLPVFVWIAWSKFNPAVVAWCVFGLTLIQVDRWAPTRGLLPHLFVHLSMLSIVAWQAVTRWRTSGRGIRIALGAAVAVSVVSLGWLAYEAEGLNTALVGVHDWISQNVPEGAWIAEDLSSLSPDSAAYHVVKFDNLLGRSSDWYRAQGWDYVVTDYGSRTESVWWGLEPSPTADYSHLTASFAQVAVFSTGDYRVAIFSTRQSEPESRVSAHFGIGGAWVDLMGYDTLEKTTVESTDFSLALYWRSFVQRRNPLQLTGRLLDRNEVEVARTTLPLYPETGPDGRWPSGVTRVFWRVSLPASVAPGLYHVELVLDSVGIGRIPVVDSQNQAVSDKFTAGPFKIAPATPSDEELDAAERGGAKFGSAFSLVAYSLSHVQPQAGGRLKLQLYWRSEARSDQNYTVFLHLLDSDGRLRAQADREPLDGLYPTSVWDVGETLRDEYALALPPDLPQGEYHLELGLYAYPSFARLPVKDEHGKDLGDRLLLNDVIQVGPGKP